MLWLFYVHKPKNIFNLFLKYKLKKIKNLGHVWQQEHLRIVFLDLKVFMMKVSYFQEH